MSILKKFWIIAGLTLFLAGVGWGQTSYTWTGLGDPTDWEDEDNWTEIGGPSTPAYPVNGDNITIQTNASNDYPEVPNTVTSLGTVTLDGGELTVSDVLTIGNLEITSNGGALDTGGNDVDVATLITLNGDLNLTGALEITDLEADGSGEVSGGTVTMDGAAVTVTGGAVVITTTNASFTPGPPPLTLGSISASTITLNAGGTGTINTGGNTFDAVTVTGNITLGSALTAGTLNNSGNLDLGVAALSATTLTNSGTISLQGVTNQVTVNGAVPAGRATGIIRYYGSASANWIFGNDYTNLIIDNTVAMSNAGALNVSETATFGSNITATSISVDEDVTLDGTGPRILNAGTGLVNLGEIAGGNLALTITASMATLNGGDDIGALQVNGDATFATAELSAVSVNVTGNSMINAGITTTGTQTYGTAPANTVTLGAGVTLEGTTVTVSGAIDGGGFDLTIDGNAILNGGSDIDDLQVNGNSTINANITTTGNQSYGAAATNTVTLGGAGTRELTSTGGSVSAARILTSTNGITVNASQGIALNNAGNNLSGTITLNNNQTGNPPDGDVSFETTATALITLVGKNPGGDFTVGSGGNITVGALETSAGGTVNLTSSTGNITATPTTGVITNTGTLILEAGTTITLTNANAVGELTVTSAGGNVQFTNDVGTGNTLTVTTASTTGTITITETTGSLEVAGPINGTTINLTATTGKITGSGEISGTSLTVSAGLGIDLDGENNVATVSLTNSISGAISYNSDRGSPPNNLSVTATNITTSGGSIKITEMQGNLIVANTPNPAIRGYSLALIAENGTVTINGNIDVYSNVDEGENAAVYIYAGTLAGNGNIILNDAAETGEVCAWISNQLTYTGTVTGTPPRIHRHFRGKHIVYTPGTGNTPPAGTGLLPGDCIFVDSTDPASEGTFQPEPTFNIYIIDVGTTTYDNIFRGAKEIEIRGIYDAPSVTLEPVPNGIVRLADSDANPGDPAEINLGSAFTITSDLEVAGANTTSVFASITAPSISIGGTIEGTAPGGNGLLLEATTGKIFVAGNIGYAFALGDIKINSNNATIDTDPTEWGVYFGGTVNAASYTQTGVGGTGGSASTYFTGAQTYSGDFDFTGTALMVSGNMTVTGTTTIDNSGLFTLDSVTISSAGGFEQTSATGGSELSGTINTTNADITFAGPITVTGITSLVSGTGKIYPKQDIEITSATKANARIRFGGEVDLNPNITITAPATGGLVEFDSGVVFSAPANTLTLEGGSSVSPLDISCAGSSTTINGNLTIAENSYVAVVAGKTLQMGSGTLPPAGFPAFTNGFAGFSGALVLEENATISVVDFYNDANINTVTINGTNTAVSTVSASGNVQLNRTFAGTLRGSTLEMTGSAKTLTVRTTGTGPQAYIGNFTVAGTGNINLGSNVDIRGNVTIDGTLNGGTRVINVYPLDNPPSGNTNTWDQTNGTFVYGTSTVEFGKAGRGAGVRNNNYEISGNTTFYKLLCNEPAANLLFSNSPHTHTIFNDITVKPLTSPGSPLDKTAVNMILLSRLDNTSSQPPSPRPPDTIDSSFWNFNLAPNAQMDLQYVYVQYCWAQNRIPIPGQASGEDSLMVIAIPYVHVDNNGASTVLGVPRVTGAGIDNDWNLLFVHVGNANANYYNVNWFVANYFFYSFTEDSNHNGKIDRIRVQAGFLLNGDFTGFEAEVDGYEIDTGRGGAGTNGKPGFGLASDEGVDPNHNDCFYIYLKEKPYPDGNASLTWRIKNTSLKDEATQFVTMDNYYEASRLIPYRTVDTVPPRINYAFTLPEHDQVFFQMSEPVAVGPDGIAFAGSPGILSGDISQNPQSTSDFLINESQTYGLAALAGGSQTFAVESVRDRAAFAEDKRNEPNARYAYQFPSPKYPVDWDYSDYEEIRGWAADPNTDFKNPAGNAPASRIKDWTANKTGGNLMNGSGPYGAGTHRITDLLISIPPQATDDEAYFVWPLWAKYNATQDPDPLGELGTLPPGYGYMGTAGGDDTFNETGIIWDFSGKRYLERDDIVMQARLNDLLSGTPQMVFAFNISDFYKAGSIQGSPGLWHSIPLSTGTPPVPNFVNMVPLFAPSIPDVAPALSSPPLFNYEFAKNLFATNGALEFFFHLNPSSDLLAGRLDIAPGSPIPGDWFRKVRPFSFDLHDITRQRSGVTILNNVINSEKRERVYVDYKLNKTGRVTIQVFTLDGNLVKVLVRENQNASDKYYRISWDGTNNGGRPVARGMYFIRIVGPDIDEIRKVMVVK